MKIGGIMLKIVLRVSVIVGALAISIGCIVYTKMEIPYKQAVQLIEQGNYEEGIDILNDLTFLSSDIKYRDADKIIEKTKKEEIYQLGIGLLKDNKLDLAIEQFESIPGYKDVNKYIIDIKDKIKELEEKELQEKEYNYKLALEAIEKNDVYFAVKYLKRCQGIHDADELLKVYLPIKEKEINEIESKAKKLVDGIEEWTGFPFEKERAVHILNIIKDSEIASSWKKYELSSETSNIFKVGAYKVMARIIEFWQSEGSKEKEYNPILEIETMTNENRMTVLNILKEVPEYVYNKVDYQTMYNYVIYPKIWADAYSGKEIDIEEYDRKYGKDYVNEMKRQEEIYDRQKKKNVPKRKVPSIGMTATEVEESSWGKPEDINKTTTIYGVSEQWCYYGNKYIYFDNGIVTVIQE